MQNQVEIIGRKQEMEILQRKLDSAKSEFVILYGRRRVGKTFLVNRFFSEHFTFRMSASSAANTARQLANFQVVYNENAYRPSEIQNAPADWFEAFKLLAKLAENSPQSRKVIFLDELPWFDTYGSDFISALDHFWNTWAAWRSDVLLLACGSAASWMINQLVHNHGGLHNRVTERVPLKPFSLIETEEFLRAKGGVFDRYQIAELYMVMGGIPFYLDQIQVNRSVAQNIDRVCFSAVGLLSTEYFDLYRSLFKRPERHISVVEALAKRAAGSTRKEIIDATKLTDGGTLTKVLDELEHSGFIRRYLPYGKLKREVIFQLTDPFTLFYLTFMQGSKATGEGAWLAQFDSQRWQAWSGYAFEYLCLNHVESIKKSLEIGGVYTEVSAWRSRLASPGVQIDLVIDRKDRIVNLCEIKFSQTAYTINKANADQLRHKLHAFVSETQTKKTVLLTFVSAYGLKPNEHSQAVVHDSLTIDALFER